MALCSFFLMFVFTSKKKFWTFEVMKEMPISKKDMSELLCDYVMVIQDEAMLK